MVHDEIRQAIDSHVFDLLGYAIDVDYFSDDGFDHVSQTMQRSRQRETVVGVALPVSRDAVDAHIQAGDSVVYIQGRFRQPEVGDWVHLPHVSQRVKAVSVVAHAGVVMAYQVVAGAG